MDFIKDVLTFIANNIFGQVPILIGLITLVGLALQRKRFEDVVAGALRATIGVVILFIGVDVFVAGLVSFQTVLASAMNTSPPTSENTMAGFLGEHGGTVALVITTGFLVHLLLVRLFASARYLYLTGHLMFWVSAITVAMLVEIAPDADQLTLVLCGAGFVAAYWTLQPLWMRPLMLRAIPDDKFGYGHTSSLTCVLTGLLVRPLGSRERHDTERLRMPRQLSFFKDINISTALVVAVIMLVGVAFADDGVLADEVAKTSTTLSPWVWGILVGLKFAGGIAILLFGVRMFLAEIVPAFKGLSDRVIPGSRPALDAPTVFPVAPTAVMVGFVAATAVFLGCLGIFAAAGWFVLVPPMIMLFFVGGAVGVFGNLVAGWRGAAVGGALTGLVLAVGQAITWGILSDTAPELATLADPDWYAIAWLLKAGDGTLGSSTLWLVPVIALAATVAVLFTLGRLETRRAGTVEQTVGASGRGAQQ